MPLESGEFIDDLVETNPVTATDPVSEGAAHIRLLKKTIQQTFPGFDEAVTLSPAELNDAARKSENETISGTWLHTSALRLSNNTPLQARNFADDANLVLCRSAVDDSLIFGDNSANAILRGLAVLGFLIGNVEQMRLETGAGNGLQVETKTGGLSRVPTLADDNTFTNRQQYNANVVHRNNQSTQWQESDLTTTRSVMLVDGSDIFKLGNPNLESELRANATITALLSNTRVAQFVTRALGSLLVDDRGGDQKKAAYRNPTLTSIGSNRSTTQDDENRVLQVSSAGITVSIDSLEVGTCYTILSPNNPFTLARGAGVNTLRFLDGLNGTTAFTSGACQPGTVLQVYHNSAGTVSVWGGGLVPS